MRHYFRLLSYLGVYWRRFTVTVIFMFLTALFAGFSVGMINPFVRVIFEPEAPFPKKEAQVSLIQEDGLVGLIQHPERIKNWALDNISRLIFQTPTRRVLLEHICIWLFVIFLLKNLFGYVQAYLMGYIEQRVVLDIRSQLYTHLNNLSIDFFSRQKTGMLISRITNDVTLVRGALTNGFSNVIRESFQVFVLVTLALIANWRLTLVALFVLPPMIWLIYRLSQRLRQFSTRAQEKMADLTSTLQETISGARVVKAFTMERYEINKFREQASSYFRNNVRLNLVGALAGPITEVLGVLCVIVILLYAGNQIIRGGTMRPEQFMVFLTAVMLLMAPLKKLAGANTHIQQGLAAARRIFDILDTKPKIAEHSEAVIKNTVEKNIAYHRINFAYNSGESVLTDIEFEVSAGEITAVVGPSGSGKSTMVDLLPRFYDPTSGQIEIDNIDIRKIKIRALRGMMGIVTQETILFNDTIRNNIAYGLKDIPNSEVVSAARAANAHEFISEMPEGYETPIGDRGVKLSGGEKQRLSIARAILKNPPILILDEATSALDTESEILVQNAVETLMQERTVFVIAHRLSTIQRADRIIVIDNGRIVQMGTHQQLIEQGGLYEKLYKIQFQHYKPKQITIGNRYTV
jgi:subfamily B ATP-binding cassette protein MsbA